MQRLHAWALAAACQLLLAALCAGQANLDTYPIDWDAVPTNPPVKNLTANCICNLNPSTCDPDCCCDTMCPAGVTAVTVANGQCLPSGPPPEALDWCVASSSVARVNLPANGDFYVTTVQPADQKLLDQLLCIVSSANPNIGEVYPDPPTGTAGQNTILGSCPIAPATPISPAQYQLNVPISVRQFTSSSPVQPLLVPYPTWSVECQDDFQPGFLQPIPPTQQSPFSQCLRTLVPTSVTALSDALVALNSECTTNSFLDAQMYTDLLYPGFPPGTTADVAQVTATAQYLNQSTGQLQQLGSVPSPRYANATCYNLLQSLNLTFVYSVLDAGSSGVAATMQIIAVEVSVIVTDFKYNASVSPVFLQAVRIDYLQDDEDSTVVVQNSGNPGYQTGYPLLAGSLQQYTDPAVGQKQAIERLTYGFPLPSGDLNGICSPTGLTPVRYGFNTTSTCAQPLTLSGLQNVCETAAKVNPALLLATVLDGLFTNITANQVYIGIWGNSNYTSLQEWVQVVQDETSKNFKTPVWLEADRGCADLVVGFTLQVVTGVAFSANNLQRKVLYVNLCYQVANWYFPMYMDPTEAYRFYLTSAVNFVPLPQQPSPVIKPHPPLGVVLPEDIFYPFVTAAAPPAARGVGAWLLMLQAAAVLALSMLLALSW